MTYIKDASELTEKEYAELEKLYVKYFKEAFVQCAVKFPRLNKLRVERNASRYSQMIVDRIKNGNTTSFVSIMPGENKRVNGFITGSIDEKETAVITHFFVDVDNHGWRREHILDLYRVFAQSQKAEGAKKIWAMSSIHNSILTDYLETVDMPRKDTYEDAAEYEKSL